MRPLLPAISLLALVCCTPHAGSDTGKHDTDTDTDADTDTDTDADTDTDDADGDGYAAADDCDDADADAFPGAPERCDGKDDDCDGIADDGATDAPTWYEDVDGDGYGGATSTSACAAPGGYVAGTGDCDDTDPAVTPGGSASCPGTTCAALRDAGVPTGLSWVQLGDTAAQAWCEQDVAGGGWMFLWKNTGGAEGAVESTYNLLVSGDVRSASPHWDQLESGVDGPAIAAVEHQTGLQLLRVDSLWSTSGGDPTDTFVRLDLDGVTLADLFVLDGLQYGVEECHTLPDKVHAWGGEDASVDMGATDQENRYYFGRLVLGFASNYTDSTGASASCGMGSDDRLDDDAGVLDRVDGLASSAGLGSLLGYDLFSTGADATRCMHACWDADTTAAWGDAFTWLVRPAE